MSAFDEIGQRGDAGGPATIALLRKLGAQVTRTSSFPPPKDHDRWSDEAVDHLLTDMFSKNPERGLVFVLACFGQATDDASLERLIIKCIRNFLIDQAKTTERGKLRRRLEKILGDDERFERPADLKSLRAWALAYRAAQLWQGHLDELHRAAAGVRGYQILSWNSAGSTPRRTVVALTAVSCGVIDHADGAVRDEDLAHVVEQRFALLTPPVFVAIPDGWFSPSESAGMQVAAEEDSIGAIGLNDRVEQLWQGLSAEEQRLLPVLGGTLKARRTATGLGRAMTEALSEALAERLRLATAHDEEREEIVLRLSELAGRRR